MKDLIQAFIAKFYQAVIIVLTAFLLLSFVGLGVQTWRASHWKTKAVNAEKKCNTEKLEIREKQIEELQKKQNEINKVSADYETEKSKQRVQVETVTRELQTIIERPVYQQSCFDDSGLQQLNSLIAAGSK
ncbi:hypothetical protein G9F32_03190 [Acinetobacter sp. 194]|uniref:hypothetical protein n=1 Tax=Acinetobacter shaoyimingii TaxID=2715164 RepID=UPI0014096E34|nr:hypothetical protein [Acinetobacter shaoyimingii]NHB57038.1 hypothetical protein [Acinetobacter shaoyimingii]